MYTLIVENEQGKQLTLTNCDVCEVLKIDGLNPPPATINMTKIAGVDGASYNSSHIEPRNIVLSLKVNDPIEYNRQQLYTYFRSKRWCRLYYQNDNRDVYIDGYVESFENDQFTMSQRPQLSIVCPKPFFKKRIDNSIEFSATVSAFEFPFSIPIEGVELGIIENSIINGKW